MFDPFLGKKGNFFLENLPKDLLHLVNSFPLKLVVQEKVLEVFLNNEYRRDSCEVKQISCFGCWFGA